MQLDGTYRNMDQPSCLRILMVTARRMFAPGEPLAYFAHYQPGRASVPHSWQALISQMPKAGIRVSTMIRCCGSLVLSEMAASTFVEGVPGELSVPCDSTGIPIPTKVPRELDKRAGSLSGP